MHRIGHLDWDYLRFVLAAARSNSISAAARHLHVNESTVSRRILSIEKQLNTALFDRTPTGIVLTGNGKQLVAFLERAERQISLGLEEVLGANEKIAGTVRLTSVPTLINHVLIPALPDLTARYSDLKIEIVATPSDLSLMQKEADIALRLARPRHEGDAISSRIGILRYAVFASRQACPDGDHAALPWISYEPDMSNLPQAHWLNAAALETGGPSPQVFVNDADAILSCIRSGIGKSLLPTVIGNADSDLIRIDSFRDLPARELWLLLHPDIRTFKRAIAVLDWIKDATRMLK